MSVKLQLKHSSTKGKAPQASDLVNGELALNINSESPAAYIKDSAGNVIQLAGLTGSETAPATPTTGQVWVDSSQTPNVINVYNGTSWIPQTGSTVSGTTAPTAPAAGQIWVDTNTTPNVVKIWDGVAWVVATPTGSDAQAIANDAKYATKDQLNAEDLWDKAGTDISPKVNGDGIVLKDGTGTASVDLDAGTSAAPLVRDSSGRLLVGTSTATATSTVKLQGNSYSANSHAILYLSRGDDTPANESDLGKIHFSDSSESFGAAIYAARNAGTWTSGSSHPTALGFATTANGAVSPTERLRITSAGLVGLGTDKPGFLADIGSSAGALDDSAVGVRVRRSGSSNSWVQINSVNALATIDSVAPSPVVRFRTSTDGSTFSERARLDASGRLLVGTSSASGDAIFVVQGYAGFSAGVGEMSIRRGGTPSAAGQGIGSIVFASDNNNTGAVVQALSEDPWTVGSSYGSRLVFATTPNGGTSSTERMRISHDSTIGFGNTVELPANPVFKMTLKASGVLNLATTTVYADNTAAKAGGLVAGDIYRKADGTLMITF